MIKDWFFTHKNVDTIELVGRELRAELQQTAINMILKALQPKRNGIIKVKTK